MFREREFKKLNSCLCSAPPKLKSTIKQFIQIEHKPQPVSDVHSNRRHSRIIELIDKSNRNLVSMSPNTPNNVTSIKYPVNQLSTYQPFPVHQENLYDEIDPIDEDLTTTYDHLSHSYMPQIRQQPYSNNGHRSQAKIEVRDVRSQYFQAAVAPPPPPIQKVPKISRQQFFNRSFNNPMATPTSKPTLNKSLNSTTNLSDGQLISERSYLFEKWAADNSSGYNSSQDLSNQTGSSNSSIISYCSINEPVMTKLKISDHSNLVDSGFSTLNNDNEDPYDATDNLSSYSNISPSSASSFNGSYRESIQDLQPVTPFPRIKTSMVAQIKKVNQQTPTKTFNLNSSCEKRSVAKSYSVSDVLISMKNMGISNQMSNAKQHQSATSKLEYSPIYNKSSTVTVIPVHYQKTSTPPHRYSVQYQRDLEDYLCDEEVESILSPKKKTEVVNPLNKISYSHLYKFNNRNVAIWEQLV